MKYENWVENVETLFIIKWDWACHGDIREDTLKEAYELGQKPEDFVREYASENDLNEVY